MKKMPSMVHAGDYSAVTQYLKAVQATEAATIRPDRGQAAARHAAEGHVCAKWQTARGWAHGARHVPRRGESRPKSSTPGTTTGCWPPSRRPGLRPCPRAPASSSSKLRADSPTLGEPTMQRPSADRWPTPSPSSISTVNGWALMGARPKNVINPATGGAGTPAARHAGRPGCRPDRRAAAFCGWRAAKRRWSARASFAPPLRCCASADAIAHGMTLEQGKPLRERAWSCWPAPTPSIGMPRRRSYGRVVPGATCTSASPCCTSRWACARRSRPGTPGHHPRARWPAPGRRLPLIIKLAEETPATGLALVRALHDAGLPAGVLNAVFGVPAEGVYYLLDSPIVAEVLLHRLHGRGQAAGAAGRPQPQARHHGAGRPRPGHRLRRRRGGALSTCSSPASSAMPARCASPPPHLCAGAGLRGLRARRYLERARQLCRQQPAGLRQRQHGPAGQPAPRATHAQPDCRRRGARRTVAMRWRCHGRAGLFLATPRCSPTYPRTRA